MKSKIVLCIVFLFVFAFFVSGCEPQGEIALNVTGDVAKEIGWTEDQVRKMDVIQVEAINKKGETDTYTGVLVTDLLGDAKLNESAATVVFVADDGNSADVSLEELQTCPDCIVSFRNQGGFSIVMPGFSTKLQVKGVSEIKVK